MSMDPDEEQLPQDNFNDESVFEYDGNVDQEADQPISHYNDDGPVSTYHNDAPVSNYDDRYDEHSGPAVPAHAIQPRQGQGASLAFPSLSMIPEEERDMISSRETEETRIAAVRSDYVGEQESVLEVSEGLCDTVVSAKSNGENSFQAIDNPMEMFEKEGRDISKDADRMFPDDPRLFRLQNMPAGKQNSWELSPKEFSGYEKNTASSSSTVVQSQSDSNPMETPKRNTSSGNAARLSRNLFLQGSPEHPTMMETKAVSAPALHKGSEEVKEKQQGVSASATPLLAEDTTQCVTPPQDQNAQPPLYHKDHLTRKPHLKILHGNHSPVKASTPNAKATVNGRPPPLARLDVSDIPKEQGGNRSMIAAPCGMDTLEESQEPLVVNNSFVTKACSGTKQPEEWIRILEESRIQRSENRGKPLNPVDFTKPKPKAVSKSLSTSRRPLGNNQMLNTPQPAQSTVSSESGPGEREKARESMRSSSSSSSIGTVQSNPAGDADGFAVPRSRASSESGSSRASSVAGFSRPTSSMSTIGGGVDRPYTGMSSASTSSQSQTCLHIKRQEVSFGFTHVNNTLTDSVKVTNRLNRKVVIYVRIPTEEDKKKSKLSQSSAVDETTVEAETTTNTEKGNPMDGFMLSGGQLSRTINLDAYATIDIPIEFRPLTAARYNKYLIIKVANPKESYKLNLCGYGGCADLRVVKGPEMKLSSSGSYVWPVRFNQKLSFQVVNRGVRHAYCCVSVTIGRTGVEARHLVVPSPRVVVRRGKMHEFTVSLTGADLEKVFEEASAASEAGDRRDTRVSMASVNTVNTEAELRECNGLLITINWGEEVQRRRVRELERQRGGEHFNLSSLTGLKYTEPFLNEEADWTVKSNYPVSSHDYEQFISVLAVQEIYVVSAAAYAHSSARRRHLNTSIDRTLMPSSEQTLLMMNGSALDASKIVDVSDTTLKG